MDWQRKHEGEVFVDHRASPGLPEHIARLAGYDPAQCGEGKIFESATLICSHCRARVIKNPLRTRERGMCLHCSNHYICDLCAIEARQPGYIHKPYEAKVEETLRWLSVPSLVAPSHGQQSPLVLRPHPDQEWGSLADQQRSIATSSKL
jgi:hypothetical protein